MSWRQKGLEYPEPCSSGGGMPMLHSVGLESRANARRKNTYGLQGMGFRGSGLEIWHKSPQP